MTLTNRRMMLAWLALVLGCLLLYWFSHHASGRHALAGFHDKVRGWGEASHYLLAPLDGESEAEPNPVPEKVALRVRVNIPSARVRIMNIGPRYRSGMRLPPDNYDIEVSARGYRTERRWVKVSAENAEPEFILNPL